MRGRFIVFEGLDGSGISTQARRLASSLDAREVPYFTTREPTDGPIGSQVRLALAKRIAFDPATLALMFAADRSDHIHAVIVPRLNAGIHVLCERYVLSSLAYQGASTGDANWIRSINGPNLAMLMPDLILFFDVPPGTALERIDAARHARELFEDVDTLALTREAFFDSIEWLRKQGCRVEVIDATAPIATVTASVATLIDECFESIG